MYSGIPSSSGHHPPNGFRIPDSTTVVTSEMLHLCRSRGDP
jgi:hypothetical protein